MDPTQLTLLTPEEHMDINIDPSRIDGTGEEMLEKKDPENSILQISALSRPLKLGMLYNARSDELIPGFSLWKTEDINSNTHVTPQATTRFQVEASESLNEKTNLLDVSASVKLSFFCGLLEAGGSAKYLSEQTSSTHQCRVTLNYHVTTELKELMISELETPKPEVFDMTEATHVVGAAIYGADALMEFQEIASDASSKQEIQGKLNMMLNKIPTIEISGEGSLQMDDEDKERVKNMSCKFYGDFQLKEIPSTYEESVKVYKELPSLLGEKGENAVPVKVWLFPLSKLCDTAFKLKKMISALLVFKIENVMNAFHEAEVRTNDLLKSSKEIKAKDIIQKLEQFQSSLRVFSIEFLQKMSSLIPAIREGTMEENALSDLLKSQDASGFSGHDMKQWLDEKETEIKIVTKYIKEIPNYEIKSPGTELFLFFSNPDVSNAFVYSFTSLSYEEPYLKKISQAAENFKSGSIITTHEQEPREDIPWYTSPSAIKGLRSSLNVFNKAPNNKVISFISDSEHPGASVRWYHYATLNDPNLITIPLQLYACQLTMDPNTAEKHLCLPNGKREFKYMMSAQPYDNLPERFRWPFRSQIPCKEPLSECCNWECESSTSNYTKATLPVVSKEEGQILCKEPLSECCTWACESSTSNYTKATLPEVYEEEGQILCKEPLSGCCYWECESTFINASIAVAYKSIDRSLPSGLFGQNDKSWCLRFYSGVCFAQHNKITTEISPSPANCNRIGVYLDYVGGTLSFYSISSKKEEIVHTVLYTFKVTFTEPLYAGFGVYPSEQGISLCSLSFPTESV